MTLIEMRLKQDLTTSELAKKAGMKPSRISDLQHGLASASITDGEAMAIAHVLGTSQKEISSVCDEARKLRSNTRGKQGGYYTISCGNGSCKIQYTNIDCEDGK